MISMRSRDEIEKEFIDIHEGAIEITQNDKLILEVLLDIRDIMREKAAKEHLQKRKMLG